MHSRLLQTALLVLVFAAEAMPAQVAVKPTSAPPKKGPGRTASRPTGAATTSIEVSVSDPSGKPFAGALVVAMPSEGAYGPWGALLPEKTRSALTSPDGKARLESMPGGPWTVTVHARGFVMQARSRVAGGPQAFQLAKGAAITGVVRDGETRAPIKGARVRVEGLELPGDWQEEAARNDATTDARGRFRLDGIGRSAPKLLAVAPGYGRGERANVSAGTHVELFLFAGASLAGTVTDEAGRPLTGALVRVEGDRPWKGYRSNAPTIGVSSRAPVWCRVSTRSWLGMEAALRESRPLSWSRRRRRGSRSCSLTGGMRPGVSSRRAGGRSPGGCVSPRSRGMACRSPRPASLGRGEDGRGLRAGSALARQKHHRGVGRRAHPGAADCRDRGSRQHCRSR